MAVLTNANYRINPINGNLSITSLGTFDVVVNRNSTVTVKESDVNDQYPLMTRLGFDANETRLNRPLGNFNFFFDSGDNNDAVYNENTSYTGNLAAIINSSPVGRVSQQIATNNTYWLNYNEITLSSLSLGFTVRGHNTIGSHKVPFITGSRDVVGYMNIHVVDGGLSAPTISNNTKQLTLGDFHVLDDSLFMNGYSSSGNAVPWKIRILNPNNNNFICEGNPIKFDRSLPWEVVQNGGLIIDLSTATANSTHTISYQIADINSKKYSATRTLTITAMVTPDIVVDPPLYLGLTTHTVSVGQTLNIIYTDLMASIPPYFQDKNYPLGAINIIDHIGNYRLLLNNSATSDRIARVLNNGNLVSRTSNTSLISNSNISSNVMRTTGGGGFQIIGLKEGSGVLKFKATALFGSTQSVMSSVTGDIKINVVSNTNQPPSALSNSTVNCYQGGQVTLDASLFSTGYVDPENDQIGFLKIVTIPNTTNNSLSYQGQDLTIPNTVIPWGIVQNGSLSYFDAGNQPVGTNITLQFTVADVGSGQYFATNRTLTIKIIQQPSVDPVPPLPPITGGYEVVGSTLLTVPPTNRDFVIGDINITDPLAGTYKQLDFRDFTTNMFPYDYNARKVRGGRITKFGYYNITDPNNPIYLTSGSGTYYLYRGQRTSESALTRVTTSTSLTDAVAWSEIDENMYIGDIGTERSFRAGKNYLFIHLKFLESFILSFTDRYNIVPFFDIALDYEGYGLDVTRVKRVSLHQMPRNLVQIFREFSDQMLPSSSYRINLNEGVMFSPDPDDIQYGSYYLGGIGVQPSLGVKWNRGNISGDFTVDALKTIQNMSGYRNLFKFHYPELDYQNTLSMTYTYFGMVNGIQMGYNQTRKDLFKTILMGGEPMINGTTVTMQQFRNGVFSINTINKDLQPSYDFLVRGSITGAVANSNEFY